MKKKLNLPLIIFLYKTDHTVRFPPSFERIKAENGWMWLDISIMAKEGT